MTLIPRKGGDGGGGCKSAFTSVPKKGCCEQDLLLTTKSFQLILQSPKA